MSISRRAARKDTGATDIVDALRAAGVKVWVLSGEGIPDLLTLYRGCWGVMELKRAAKADRLDKRNGRVYRSEAGKLTPAQEEFVAAALEGGAVVPVVSSPAEALAAVGVGTKPRIDPEVVKRLESAGSLNEYLSAALDLPPGMTWADLAAAVRRGG